MSLPLDGIRIIAIEQYGAGPFATQHLADLGAEVIKVENAATGGDVGRVVGPHFVEEGDSLFYQSFNRNKKSVAIDLKTDDGMADLRKLVKDADVLFNNLRGDLPAKLGLDFAAMKATNPAIVCAHLSAYGRTGKRASWPGYDYLMQAEAGFLSVTGEPDGPPARFGLSIVDMMTGTTAALAMVSAVLGAHRTGQGRDIDVSLFDVALHNLTYVATWYLNEGDVVGRSPRSGHPSLVPSQLYRTSDGWLFIMCNKEKFWGVLADQIGKPEWKSDPRYVDYAARLKNRDTLTQELDGVLSHATTAEWLERLRGHVPVAPVNDVAQALDNPFVAEQDLVVDTDHAKLGKIKLLASPIRCPGEVLPQTAAPGLGADTDALLPD
ncbi:MAG: CoA transferase [Rhodobacteraceae bacterium]|nr:CoA transferase [Paracoccaceae bacterium]